VWRGIAKASATELSDWAADRRLDAAKAIGLKVTHAAPLAEYDDLLDGGTRISSSLPPYIAIRHHLGHGQRGVAIGRHHHRKNESQDCDLQPVPDPPAWRWATRS